MRRKPAAREIMSRERAQSKRESSSPSVGDIQRKKASPGQNTANCIGASYRSSKPRLMQRILCWLVQLAACLMNRCDIGSDRKDAATQSAWTKGQHSDSGIRREDPVHAGQARERGGSGTCDSTPGVFMWRC